jgi:hypothetical protein
MSQPDDAAIQSLTVKCLHQAIRRGAARILESPDALSMGQFRQVERLMRVAIALAGGGRGLPTVQVHGIPSTGEPDALPEVLTVPLTDLLAARASDHLTAAIDGDADALRALQKVADRLLETEDIQL